MITRRSLILCIAPLLTLALIVWPLPRYYTEAVGLTVFVLLLLCAFTASRLSKDRRIPDLRIPFFLNLAGALGLAALLARSLTFALWYYITHRAAG